MKQRTTEWIWLTAGGIIGGLLFSGLLALAGRFVGAASPTGWGDLVGAVNGLLLGAPLGILFGLWLMGRWRGDARLWMAIPAVIISAALVLLLAEPLRLNATPQLLLVALVVIPTAVAALILVRSQKNA